MKVQYCVVNAVGGVWRMSANPEERFISRAFKTSCVYKKLSLQ